MSGGLALSHRSYCVFFLWFFLCSSMANASDIAQQVNYCKEVLEVDNFPGAGSCFDETYPLDHDTQLAYFRLNSSVDAVLHCDGIGSMSQRRIEMIIHKRNTGDTCFFAVDTPSNTGEYPSLNNADPGWIIGKTSGAGSCVGCHKNGGPYFIPKEDTAKAMAHFGLINNNHVTNFDDGNRLYRPRHYNGLTEVRMWLDVQEAHPDRSDLLDGNDDDFDGVCGGACHNYIRFDDIGFADIVGQLTYNNLMPPRGQFNPWRWINRDNQAGKGDFERLTDVKENTRYAPLVPCETPLYMQAHVVGDDQIINSNSEYANLRSFNPIDGLICKNAEIENGKCQNYEARFYCEGLGWTNWQDNDTPNATGDHERPPKGCGTPTKIEARRADGSWSFSTPVGSYGEGPQDITHVVRGFPDRLERFDSEGLICRNSDQDDGNCSNYSVRFICPD